MTTNHSEFYFSDGLATIQVENTMFKLHNYKLKASEFFVSKMIPYEVTFGRRSDEWSLVLEGVSVPDFVCLLKVLYASRFSAHQVVAEPSLLIPALRLSHKWGFKELYAHLVELAEIVLDDVDKVALARELDTLS